LTARKKEIDIAKPTDVQTNKRLYIFTTRRYATAVYAMALCLSVRLSVKRREYCQNG